MALGDARMLSIMLTLLLTSTRRALLRTSSLVSRRSLTEARTIRRISTMRYLDAKLAQEARRCLVQLLTIADQPAAHRSTTSSWASRARSALTRLVHIFLETRVTVADALYSSWSWLGLHAQLLCRRRSLSKRILACLYAVDPVTRCACVSFHLGLVG